MMHDPPHPGEVLAYYMEGRSVTDVAAHIGVTRPALSRILNRRAAISAEMAIRLGKAFGTDPSIWLKLQMQRDLWAASRKKLKVTRLAAKPAA